MKLVVVELIALSLMLGLIWATETTERPSETMTTANSTNTTSAGGGNGGNGNGNGNGGGNNNNNGGGNNNNNGTNSTGTQTTKSPTMTYMTTKNGQNHVFTSVHLLLGSFLLGAVLL